MKLFLVTLRGMQAPVAFGMAHGTAYVVAEDPTSAYQKVRDELDKHDFGFAHERELSKVELLAEDSLYPGCRIRLYR